MRRVRKQRKRQNLKKKELNKTEISSLPDKEFKVIVIKMLTERERRVDEPMRASTKK